MSTAPRVSHDLLRQSAEAMRLLLAGDVAGGIASYRECLRAGPDMAAQDMPVGVHLQLLDAAGKGEAAAALRQLALSKQRDISMAAAVGRTPAEAAAEYERLLAGGAVNAPMASNYLVALGRLGQADRAAAIFDTGRLLRVQSLDLALADEVAAELLRRAEGGAVYEGPQPAHGMVRLRRLDQDGHPAIAALIAECAARADGYLGDWAASDHIFANAVPAGREMRAWGLVSRDQGHLGRHIHPRAWLSCVYYPAGLDVPGGELRVGTPEGCGDLPGWPDIAIRPEAGLLVMMPSFYTHWTVPLERPALRISVAFDIGVFD